MQKMIDYFRNFQIKTKIVLPEYGKGIMAHLRNYKLVYMVLVIVSAIVNVALPADKIAFVVSVLATFLGMFV